MVRIAIDYDGDEWQERALRILRAGGRLISVPEERVESIVDGARRMGLEVDACEQEEDGAVWSIGPS